VATVCGKPTSLSV